MQIGVKGFRFVIREFDHGFLTGAAIEIGRYRNGWILPKWLNNLLIQNNGLRKG